MNRVLVAIALSLTLAAAAVADSGTPLLITAAQREALGIEVGAAEARDLVPRPRLPGRVALPNAKVRLVTARSSGVLLSLTVAVGDAITAGQELARLESPSLVSLQREYLEALSRLGLARSRAGREAQLAEEGIIAGRRATQSTALLREAQARLEERRQALVLSGMSEEGLAALTKTRQLQPTIVLRAPFSGVVLEQFAHAGERLDAGGALYRIGDLDALTVEIHTPLDIARSLREGTRFVLPDEGAKGRVIGVGSAVHSLDQGVLVRGAIIEDEAAQLRPGQFVRVQFETAREHGSAYAVPSTAVVHVEGHAWVFRQVESGFEPLAVEIVGGADRETVIAGPLSDGTPLVFRGTAALKAYWLADGGPG